MSLCNANGQIPDDILYDSLLFENGESFPHNFTLISETEFVAQPANVSDKGRIQISLYPDGHRPAWVSSDLFPW